MQPNKIKNSQSSNHPRRIVVFGANGRVGSQVVELALEANHLVVAFVYGESKLNRHDNLEVIRGDARNSADVRRALREADLVISALGSWGTKTKDILTTGMKTVVPVMEELRINRIVSLTGADAQTPDDRPTWINRLSRGLIGVIGGRVIRDGEDHIQVLANSKLDWTVVRSPIMTGGKLLPYKLTGELAPPYATIPRKSVAQCLLDLALSNDHLRSNVTILKAKI